MKFAACIIIVLATFYGCQKKVTYPEYYGTWKNSTKMVLHPNGIYKWYIRDSVDVFKDSPSKFTITEREDTIWLIVKHKNLPMLQSNGEVRKRNHTKKHAINLRGDYITILSYKCGKGINNHIDEYCIFVKDVPNPNIPEYSGTRITYVFPKNFVGAAWIAFNQPNGISPEYDSDGNPIIRIPENGILQTTLHEDAFATANGYYSIVKDYGGKLSSLKSFDKFDRFDSTCYHAQDTIAIVYGFNQTYREDFNENIFHKEISGNILSIYVGNLSWDEEREEWAHPPTLVQKN